MVRTLWRSALLGALLVLAATHGARSQDGPVPKDEPGAPGPIFTFAPTPAPSLEPGHQILTSGNLRSYEYYRTNGVQNDSNPNRQAFNLGTNLHGEYHFRASPLYVGATYTAAYPFGFTGQQPQLNNAVDNSLPGFALNAFDEAFLGYSTAHVQAKVGNQIINTPFADAGDSRMKPAAFQGASLAATFGSGWTVMLDDMIRFQSRTSSSFGRYTLLTAPVPGNTSALVPSTSEVDTSGFVLGALGYQWDDKLGLAAFDYNFESIANLLFVQGQWNLAPGSKRKPFVALQYVSESNLAPALVGKIDNQTFGLGIGATTINGLELNAGIDRSPWRSVTLPLSGCNSANLNTTGYFLPSGGTPFCVAHPDGTATIYYGGIAAPYTVTDDPIYTNSLTQGMAARRSAGTSEKIEAVYRAFRKQLRLILSQAWYNYGNAAGPNLTREFDADGTWFFSPVALGAYRGLSLRYRYGDRTQPTLPFDFKANRIQLEYDF